jgi:hypothetical protein
MTLDSKALIIATVAGTVLQVGMVVSGHDNANIAKLYAVGGMGFSLLAGMIYGSLARNGTTADALIGGLIAGALCAFIGIFISYRYGDVPASLLALGTISSAVTGLIGGWVGRFLARMVVGVAAP